MERIGHRGAPSHATENTLPSFLAAADLGVDAIELDVRLSADREAVVLHDESLERTGQGQGKVGELSAEQLAAHQVPTYVEVLNALRGRCQVTCEVKELAAAPVALATTQAAQALSTTVFTSFVLEAIEQIRAADPQARVGGLIGVPDERFIGRLVACGAELADVYWPNLTADWVAQAHRWGLKVRAWTVNDDEALAKVVAAGVDGVMSDRPEWLVSRLGADGRLQGSSDA